MTYNPLIVLGDITSSPIKNVIAALDNTEQTQLLTDASRAVESYCDRKLATFTGNLEVHRAQDIDVDAQADIHVPLDLQGTLGTSRARSLGANDLVRHCFVDQAPPVHKELWSGALQSVKVIHAIGGSTTLDLSSNSTTFEPTTGEILFPLGTYIVQGDILEVTYSGGYSVSTPEDLKRATVYELIEQGLIDIFPMAGLGKDFDLGLMREKKALLLDKYVRDDSWA